MINDVNDDVDDDVDDDDDVEDDEDNKNIVRMTTGDVWCLKFLSASVNICIIDCCSTFNEFIIMYHILHS